MLDIMLNGSIISRSTYQTDTQNAAESNMSSIILKLNKGDRVWVENHYAEVDVYNSIHSYFTGALIYSIGAN